eukprot:9612680-Prorocentrum_lima.AAC.1
MDLCLPLHRPFHASKLLVQEVGHVPCWRPSKLPRCSRAREHDPVDLLHEGDVQWPFLHRNLQRRRVVRRMAC